MGAHLRVRHRNKLIVKQYREGMSIIDLAKEFGISKSSVCGIMQTAGWPDRHKVRTIEERAIRALFTRSGWSEANLMALGAKLGYNRGEIRDLLSRIVKGEPDPIPEPVLPPIVYTKPPKLVAPEIPGEKVTDEFGAYVDSVQGELDNDE